MKALAACARRHVAACDTDPRTVAAVARAARPARGDGGASSAAAATARAARPTTSRSPPSAGARASARTSIAATATASSRHPRTSRRASPASDAPRQAIWSRRATIRQPASATLARCATAVDKESARLVTSDVEGAGPLLGRAWRRAGTRTRARRRATGAPDRRSRPPAARADDAHLQGVRRRGPRVRRRGRPRCPRRSASPAPVRMCAVPGGASCGGTDRRRSSDLVGCVICIAAHDGAVRGSRGGARVRALPAGVRGTAGDVRAPASSARAAPTVPPAIACLDNGSGTTRYCVGGGCSADGECSGGAVCRQYCTFAGCEARRCVCPGFACGADEVCIDDGGLACRELCTQDSDCPPPLGVCVNSTFGAGPLHQLDPLPVIPPAGYEIALPRSARPWETSGQHGRNHAQIARRARSGPGRPASAHGRRARPSTSRCLPRTPRRRRSARCPGRTISTSIRDVPATATARCSTAAPRSASAPTSSSMNTGVDRAGARPDGRLRHDDRASSSSSRARSTRPRLPRVAAHRAVARRLGLLRRRRHRRAGADRAQVERRHAASRTCSPSCRCPGKPLDAKTDVHLRRHRRR